MNGIAAINAAHGWSIAVVGVTIVFTGLTVLSIVISQLHKLLNLWDRRSTWFQGASEIGGGKEAIPDLPDIEIPSDTVRQAKLLVDLLGEPFSLPKLLRFAKKCGMDRPHKILNDLVRAGRIVPDGRGYYKWNENE